MVTKPPVSIPGLNLIPIMDKVTGRLNPAWFGFFSDLTAPATPIEVVTVGASPFTYTAVHAGSLLIKGGTVNQISLIRARVTVITGLTTGFIPMSQNDQVEVTYAVIPDAWYVPNGNPA